MSIHEQIEKIEEILEEIKNKAYEDIKKDLIDAVIIETVCEDPERFVLAMLQELGTDRVESILDQMSGALYKHGSFQ